jgi:citrate lyase subunit beta/citryl-CoA lyase
MNAASAKSLLFVPGDRPERFDKAAGAGADVVIIDLEDAVAAESKDAALHNVIDWIGAGGAAMVRVNGVGTVWHDRELAALAATGVEIMVPKAQSARALESVHAVVGNRIVALVETAAGVRDADAVATAPGVVRLALGNVDLAAELGVDPGSHAALAYSRGRLVVASAAAGISAPIDGVTTVLSDPDVLTRDLEVMRELGLGGKLCIHPRQVGRVKAAFLPDAQEVSWARRVLEAAVAGGVGVVDGAMIDAPVVARARTVLARAVR